MRPFPPTLGHEAKGLIVGLYIRKIIFISNTELYIYDEFSSFHINIGLA